MFRRQKWFLAGGMMVFLGILVLVWGVSLFYPPCPPGFGRTVSVIVPRHASTGEIGWLLQEKGLVRSGGAFSFYARLKGVDSQLKAGRYTFTTSMPLGELVDRLVAGEAEVRVVTIPEGFTVNQIADLLEREGLASRQEFLTAAANADFPYPFIKNLPPGPNRLEGYLYPDTYYLGYNLAPQEIIEMMLSRFAQKMKELDYSRRAEQAGLTLHQAVTIASMVEREAKVDEERPLIAGVILNRLRLGMPLQVDATVQYALGTHRAKLYYRDLGVNSPYNTYLFSGLPPGPIACPGEASLLAAVLPARTEYLYYVARPDGTHAFARTLEEHNANKKKYQS
ncbi:endolytic transglycosylase MltG [Desulfovirgula thermocuniculi]|uniref:endolytic transglycosylase MltG n=1 Tax=Desulfovirgula thermocuniculi TaxID=348842 RepID=UPI0004220E99|nr:endolytic transglycosylase MltG [Desulfovirgula thermocuniculi]